MLNSYDEMKQFRSSWKFCPNFSKQVMIFIKQFTNFYVYECSVYMFACASVICQVPVEKRISGHLDMRYFVDARN